MPDATSSTPSTWEGDGFILDPEDTLKISGGATLYRVVATRSRRNGTVKSGSRGGYVHGVRNLSGNAWVGEKAMVLDAASRVCDAALVEDTVMENAAVVREDAEVSGSRISGSTVSGSARVRSSTVEDDCLVSNRATVVNSSLFQMISVMDHAHVRDSSVKAECWIGNNATVAGSFVSSRVKVLDFSRVADSSVSLHSVISGTANVVNDSIVSGRGEVSGTAVVDASSVLRGSKILGEAHLLDSCATGSVIRDQAKMVHAVMEDGMVGGSVEVVDEQLEGVGLES